jgi:hypothetical protein
LIVVMSGFQLPSIDVAAAADGVAFNSSLNAFARSVLRRPELTPGCSLRRSMARASFTSTQL